MRVICIRSSVLCKKDASKWSGPLMSYEFLKAGVQGVLGSMGKVKGVVGTLWFGECLSEIGRAHV